MADFFAEISLFPLVLTLGSYQIGLWCQRKTRSALCNPLLVAALLSIGALLLMGMDPQDYAAGTAGISWLLTPATVCLAVPLYEQLKALKGHLPAILSGILAGTLTSLLCVFVMCRLFGLENAITLSLLPKSVTTAIGLALTENAGGLSALTAAAIIITGILGNLTGSFLCKWLKIANPIAQGVGFGTASHVIGTSRATEVDPLAGAVSSLSLAVAGILTAILFPILLMLL